MLKGFILGMLVRHFISIIAWRVWQDCDARIVICTTGIWCLILKVFGYLYAKIMGWYITLFYGRFILKYNDKEWCYYDVIIPIHKTKKLFKVIYPESTEPNKLSAYSVKVKMLPQSITMSEFKRMRNTAKKLDLTKYGQK